MVPDDMYIAAAFWGHEPIQFYRRRAAAPDSVLGRGRWTEAWYARLHAKEAIDKLADTGISMIWTHFFKGFGLEFEKEEMLTRTRKLVELCHARGIKVLGYCTIGTVYWETIIHEIPDIGDKVRKDSLGNPYYPAFDGGFPSRWYACYSGDYHETYLKKVVDFGITEIGLDGFHFDNAGSGWCGCEHCQAAFREYLSTHVSNPHDLGLWDYGRVGIPPVDAALDPLKVHYLHFRRWLCAKVHADMFRHVKSRSNGKAYVIYNPGFGRPEESIAYNGYEPGCLSKDVDFVFLETGHFIRKTEFGLDTAVFGMKLAELLHVRPFDISWWHNDKGAPDVAPPNMVRLHLAESLAFAGMGISNIIARSLKHGADMVLDRPEIRELCASVFAHLQKHPEIYRKPRRTSAVKFLYLEDARLLGGVKYTMNLFHALGAAVENGIPSSIVHLGDALEPQDAIVLACAEYLSDSDVERIKALPCRVIVIGSCALYDDTGAEREKPLPFTPDVDELENWRDNGAILAFKKAVAATLPRPIKFSAPCILADTCVDENGDDILHLLNSDCDAPADNLVVELPQSYSAFQAFSFEELPEVRLFGNRLEIARLVTQISLKMIK